MQDRGPSGYDPQRRLSLKEVLAVDFGGTKTTIAAVDEAGHIRQKQKLAAAADFEGSIDQVRNWLAGESARPAAAGIIVPGIVQPAAGSAWAPNLWGQEFHPLRAVFQERLDLPIALGNDRTGSVLGEQWLGVARGLRHVVFVAVGTGIGVGIVADGRPVEGAHGIAGAAGWMVVGGPWKPEYAACGGWETEAAGPGLARRAGMESAEAVAAAARAGNSGAIDALNQTADYLAAGIAGLIALLDPEMVVLGGGVMQASDLVLERIRRQALCWTQPVAARQVRIEKTALGEDAGLVGAARLGWLLERERQGG